MHLEYNTYRQFKQIFTDGNQIIELEQLLDTVKNLHFINDHIELQNRLSTQAVFEGTGNLRQSLIPLMTRLRSEIGENLSNIITEDQVKRYLFYMYNDLRELRYTFGVRFRIEAVNEVLELAWNRLDANTYRILDDVMHLDRTIESAINFIIGKLNSVVDANSQSDIPKEIPVATKSNYLLEPNLINDIYKEFNGKLWDEISHMQFLSCFDLSSTPIINLKDKFTSQSQNSFVFILTCLKKDGKHSVNMNLGTDPNDLINEELAETRFGIKNYKNLKYQVKKKHKQTLQLIEQVKKVLKNNNF
jgi:hypothetical protein